LVRWQRKNPQAKEEACEKIQDESNQEKEKPGGKGRARAVDGTLKTPETGQKALAD
jgi:hypothetical protein